MSIQKLQNAVHESLYSIENTLPIVTSFTVLKNTNVLSFLYENFGDLDKEGDFMTRNHIGDPFELQGNRDYQVIQ